MKIQHLRNATTFIHLGDHRILLDPMLSKPGALPGFKLFGGGRRRNPLVPLPPEAEAALASATAVLVTHEHPDHFDKPGLRWAKERGLPVWASPIDAPNLRKKGLDVHELADGALGMRVELVPARHGRGIVGWLMGPVAGVYLAAENEPSVYFTSDATLDDRVLDAVDRLKPDVVVAPAGAANAGLGGDILFSMDELMTLAHRAPGQVVFNHLEAIDHCPTTREELRQRVASEGLADRVHVPEDGETMSFDQALQSRRAEVHADALKPGFQKWFTSPFTMT